MSIKNEVHGAAHLICLNLDIGRENKVIESFEELLEYFSIMDAFSQEEHLNDDILSTEIKNDSLLHAIPLIPYSHTEELVERSEENEDNYILIPNIL